MSLALQELRVVMAGTPILDVPSFGLAAHAVTALIGPNGAGKSTLLQVLAGVRLPTTGHLLRDDRPVCSSRDRRHHRQRVTLVFQETLLLQGTVAWNLDLPLRLAGVNHAIRQKRVHREAARFGIEGLLDRSVRMLSGGEARRVALARALALEPDVLLLDEPFASLDPPSREALMQDLGQALSETSTTTLMTTHDLDEALRLASHLAVMDQGRIIQHAALSQVVNQPATPLVAQFVGMETLFEGTVVTADRGVLRLAVAGACMEVVGDHPVGSRLLLGLRPEHIALEPQAFIEGSMRNHWPCRIRSLQPQGSVLRVALEGPADLVAFVTHPSADALDLTPGGTITASFKATAVHILRTLP